MSTIPGFFVWFLSHMFVQCFYLGSCDYKGNSAIVPQTEGKEQIKTHISLLSESASYLKAEENAVYMILLLVKMKR